MSNKQAGDSGEIEVIELLPCPNCGKKLMTLPANYPLYDVQCTGCSFRAQVKTNLSKPKKEIFGAGWQIMDKVLKSGFLIPPMMANFKWEDKSGNHQEIRFYPFVSKNNLKKYQLPPTAKRANYWMFNYIKLDVLPHFVLYKNKKPDPGSGLRGCKIKRPSILKIPISYPPRKQKSVNGDDFSVNFDIESISD